MSENDVVEILTRLNAKTHQTLPMPAGYGSLTTTDIAHAVSFIKPKGARLLARVLIADQVEFTHELEHELLNHLKHFARQKGWKNVGPLKGLSEIAIHGYCNQRKCQACKGVQWRLVNSKPVKCWRCQGKPLRPILHTDIYEKIGVSERQYFETWKPRFGEAWDKLLDWHGCISEGLLKALKRR